MKRNKNKITQLILLDLNKAFDTVRHKALIIKLHEIKMPSSLIDIITNYLCNRKFYVSINGKKSTCKKVTAGVPQLF